jgi:hypothetical protein
MALQVEALGGPVLAWEMTRAGRRKLGKILWIAYSVWLVLQAFVLFLTFSSATSAMPKNALSSLDRYFQQLEFFDDYLALLLQLQLMLIVALVPALTASSLGQEKERGTLFALFGTALTSRQILLGKLLGRLHLIVPLMLTTVPVLIFTATLAGRGILPIVLALAQEAVWAFALGAICLLFGIWIRRAADAVIASYLFLGLAYYGIRALTPAVPWAFWVDPFDNLGKLVADGTIWPFVFHLAVWACLGTFCLRLGWGRLRKVCVEQRDKKPSRRIWAFRPPVGNNPIRWRECHIIGLAPIPILRLVPRWLALVAVFLFSTVIAVLSANNTSPGLLPALWSGDPVKAIDILWGRRGTLTEPVSYSGLLFIALADILLLVRCGTSVAEEKRRNTWDDLLLTAQSFREITNGKMWGILQATAPYLIAYALPVFILAALEGPGGLAVASMWIIAPSAVVFIAALSGIDMVKVPRDMDETREGGAFWFENERAVRRRYQTRRGPWLGSD